MLNLFFDKLAERLAVMVGRLVAFSFESLHATHQAAQQSRLEDLARHYEAAGKNEIAANLRRQVTQLASDDPASLALAIAKNLTRDAQLALPSTETPPAADLAELPRLTSHGAKSRRKAPACDKTEKTNP